MGGSCLFALHEESRTPGCGDEPKKQVGEQDPDGVLHADDALVALGVLVDVHFAEDAESDEVK